MMDDYNEQAEQFLKEEDITFKARYLGHFPRLGKDYVANYLVIFSKEGKKDLEITFSDSIINSYNAYTKRDDYTFTRPKLLSGWEMSRILSYPHFKECVQQGKSGESETGVYARINKNKPSVFVWIKQTHTDIRPYDVLACLAKYDPESFKDFCANYGYNDDSITALRTYEAVREEWYQVKYFFDDLEGLREIE